MSAYDKKKFFGSSYSSDQRKYSLDQFNVPQDNLLYFYPSGKLEFDVEQCSIDYYLNDEKVENFLVDEVNVLQGNLPDDKVLLIKDWFESDVFFASDKDDILDRFQPKFDTRPIEHLIQLISTTNNSVSVHIRRGDMGRKNDFRLISISYQQEAMDVIKQKLNTTDVTFFVFTDDLDYVKASLVDGNVQADKIIYMSDYTDDISLFDFLLMSICQHNIIANSSFSWWAAYLNRNPRKMVVAPMPKYRPEWIQRYFPMNHSRQLLGELAYPKDWIRIKPTFLTYPDV